MGRPGIKEHGKVVGRRSPPASVSTGASKQMLVRRSKSSAILPLRKHLIEKTLAEQQQKAAAAAMAAATVSAASSSAVASASSLGMTGVCSGSSEDKSLAIRPIEEVMEEDVSSRTNSLDISAGSQMMEVDMSPPALDPQSGPRHFAARLGTAGKNWCFITAV